MTNNGKIIEGTFSEPEFEYLADNMWEWTEKLDGTCIRIMFDGKDVKFGGKTDKASILAFLLNKLMELFSGDAKKQLFTEVFPPKYDNQEETKVCLYGEGYGNKIQATGKDYNPKGVDFALFDVKIGHTWLERENVADIAGKFGIEAVPVIGRGTLKEMVNKVKEGFNSKWGNFIAEGIVARPKTELQTRRGYRIITKIKCKDFV